MYEEDPNDQYYSIELNINGIRAIHAGLSQAVEKWQDHDGCRAQIDGDV